MHMRVKAHANAHTHIQIFSEISRNTSIYILFVTFATSKAQKWQTPFSGAHNVAQIIERK